MKTANRLLLASLVLCAAAFSSRAQEEYSDTTGFNALEYTMQKRWRPGNADFVNGKFSDNMSLKLDGGTEQLLERSSSSYSFGPLFRATVGKGLDRFNTIYAGASAGLFRRNADGVKVFRGGVELGHSFDFSSYFWGYDPNRVLWLRSMESVGLNLSRAAGDYRLSATVRAGLTVSAQIAEDAEIFYQPEIAFYTDGIDCSPTGNWRKFDFGYGFEVGMIFHFNRFRSHSPFPSSFGEWFASDAYVMMSGGCGFQISDATIDAPGLFPSAREAVQLAYGKNVKGPLAVEFSLFYSRDVWKQFSGGRNKYCYYGGVRPQIVFDTMYWLKEDWFAMPVMAGPEIGLMYKKDDGYAVKRVYMGLSVALRPDFRLHRRLALFLEPRLSIVPYTFPPHSNNSLMTGSRNWYDLLVNLSFGFRINL